MTRVTINDVREGIMMKINSFRDEGTKIYGESIEQGFSEPCFFIKEIRSSQTKELGNRYKRGHSYDIHYFPSPSESKNEEMLNMAEVLYDELEYIEVAGKLTMAYDMEHRIADGVLHFFVKYPFFVYKEVVPGPEMENLYQKGDLKDG